MLLSHERIQRGDKGPDTPGISQVIWVSIGNKQLDPPPPLENVGPPLEPLKMIFSFESNQLRTKTNEKKKRQSFFLSDGPGPP